MSDRVEEHERAIRAEAIDDFLVGHARRIAETAGFEWDRLPPEQRSNLAWMVGDVLENLRWIDGCDGGYIKDRRPPPDGTEDPDVINTIALARSSHSAEERVSGEKTAPTTVADALRDQRVRDGTHWIAFDRRPKDFREMLRVVEDSGGLALENRFFLAGEWTRWRPWTPRWVEQLDFPAVVVLAA